MGWMGIRAELQNTWGDPGGSKVSQQARMRVFLGDYGDPWPLWGHWEPMGIPAHPLPARRRVRKFRDGNPNGSWCENAPTQGISRGIGDPWGSAERKTRVGEDTNMSGFVLFSRAGRHDLLEHFRPAEIPPESIPDGDGEGAR